MSAPSSILTPAARKAALAAIKAQTDEGAAEALRALHAVAVQRQELAQQQDDLLVAAVAAARSHPSVSWSAIGTVIGQHAKNANRKFGPRLSLVRKVTAVPRRRQAK